MIDKVLRTIKNFGMLRRGERVLCALSGGVDSSVLLDVLIKCKDELGIEVCAAHLNHMLRGAEADSDEQFVREKCKAQGIPLISERVDIAAIARETGQSEELAARNVRYDFLRRAKESFGAFKIATAHNANDNLETVIFNLARGSGIDGLCGIPPVRGDVIRPLIEVTRDEIEDYAERFSVSFCEDKTNLETVYTRNKIRHNIIPEMLKLNDAAVKNAARTSGLLRAESEFLKEAASLAAEKIAKSSSSCDKNELLKLSRALFGRVCEIFAARAAEDGGYTLEYCHVCDILNLCRAASPSGEVSLPLGVFARREYDELVFEKKTANAPLVPLVLSEGEHIYGEHKISVKKAVKNGKINNSVNTFLIPCDKIQSNLVVRPRREGDEIKLLKRPKKSLKKLFIEARVPKLSRDNIPVIASGDAVVAVFGFGQDEGFSPSENSENLYIQID